MRKAPVKGLENGWGLLVGGLWQIFLGCPLFYGEACGLVVGEFPLACTGFPPVGFVSQPVCLIFPSAPPLIKRIKKVFDEDATCRADDSGDDGRGLWVQSRPPHLSGRGRALGLRGFVGRWLIQ